MIYIFFLGEGSHLAGITERQLKDFLDTDLRTVRDVSQNINVCFQGGSQTSNNYWICLHAKYAFENEKSKWKRALGELTALLWFLISTWTGISCLKCLSLLSGHCIYCLLCYCVLLWVLLSHIFIYLQLSRNLCRNSNHPLVPSLPTLL